ncbi:hypothetical protein IWQ60_000056 [Tieghemiomyces parasiticus]|uniref:HSF-type DNA-binding domain-containing protein n=1 Tax=Tieghemiomyces parasiticus TaxID=78921 RepID=A0A9W8ANA2_9FUNG|nr:hypothetical protein IWQ60_000056 [Tieghemiomyces parasiticus]
MANMSLSANYAPGSMGRESPIHLQDSATIPPFAAKLYDGMDNSDFSSCIAWDPSGTILHVTDIKEFTKVVLPAYFKTRVFNSFVRQLHIYGFTRKSDARKNRGDNMKNQCTFQHPYFQKGRRDLLVHIRRQAQKSGRDRYDHGYHPYGMEHPGYQTDYAPYLPYGYPHSASAPQQHPPPTSQAYKTGYPTPTMAHHCPPQTGVPAPTASDDNLSIDPNATGASNTSSSAAAATATYPDYATGAGYPDAYAYNYGYQSTPMAGVAEGYYSQDPTTYAHGASGAELQGPYATYYAQEYDHYYGDQAPTTAHGVYPNSNPYDATAMAATVSAVGSAYGDYYAPTAMSTTITAATTTPGVVGATKDTTQFPPSPHSGTDIPSGNHDPSCYPTTTTLPNGGDSSTTYTHDSHQYYGQPKHAGYPAEYTAFAPYGGTVPSTASSIYNPSPSPYQYATAATETNPTGHQHDSIYRHRTQAVQGQSTPAESTRGSVDETASAVTATSLNTRSEISATLPDIQTFLSTTMDVATASTGSESLDTVAPYDLSTVAAITSPAMGLDMRMTQSMHPYIASQSL